MIVTNNLVSKRIQNIIGFYIRVNNPTLNNNIGKFNTSHILDRVLLNINKVTITINKLSKLN